MNTDLIEKILRERFNWKEFPLKIIRVEKRNLLYEKTQKYFEENVVRLIEYKKEKKKA